LPVAKRDLTTILVLSVVFFVMSTWALGRYDVPLSTWQPNGGEIFFVDFGSVKNVSAIYVLVRNGSINFDVYTGHPRSWDLKSSVSMERYYRWDNVSIDEETQFIRFAFTASNRAEIAEISALGGNGQKIVINTVKGENCDDAGPIKLVDEQEKVECPPTYQSRTYFDEIYYVRTAEDYLDLREPYEWTHPPLGKLILAGGILFFGYSPFGWRIVEVLLATLMIPVIYLLGKKMFGTWIGAFAAAFLLVFDFMHFTMARIATLDTFVVFFSLVSQFFFFAYLKNVLSQGWQTATRPLLLSIVFFSLAFSTKWSALFGFLGQMFILLVLRLRELPGFNSWTERARGFFSRPFLSVVVFLAIGAGIYLFTYLPYIMVGHTQVQVFRMQWYMYNYHSTLVATHPFSSQWWTWPLMTRPMWFYVSDLPGGNVSTIVSMGNPAVWWVGLVSIALVTVEGLRRKNYVCLFIATAFLFQWLPYALVSRTSFLYYFYFNVPFLILANVYFINKYWNTRYGKVVGLFYLTVVAILFMAFYPVISGLPVPSYWRDALQWFASWKF